MFCNKCGNEINEKSNFCNKCGTKINQSSKKEKKETSKGVRIFIIILLSILLIYLVFISLGSAKKAFSKALEGEISLIIIWLVVFALTIWCGYGLIKNISKLKGKELTAEQLQKTKKRNTILGLSSVLAVVLVIVVMFGYDNISESKEKEQMISKIKEYQHNGYLELSDNEYQKLETSSNSEIKERLDRIENNIKLQKEYNEKYSAKLDEVYAKEIKFKLYPSYDEYYTYIPANLKAGTSRAKAQVEFVTINTYADDIYEIYYSVEMDLTVQNKYNGRTISNGLTKKYYKIAYRQDINEIQQIDNYNDTAIQEELNNIIDGKLKEVLAVPSKNDRNYKYNFLHVK